MVTGKRSCKRNESSFLYSPFLLCFPFVQGSGFRVQGLGFRVEVAASPPFLEDGILALSEQIHAYVEKE